MLNTGLLRNRTLRGQENSCFLDSSPPESDESMYREGSSAEPVRAARFSSLFEEDHDATIFDLCGDELTGAGIRRLHGGG
jgi:hypothetical protein